VKAIIYLGFNNLIAQCVNYHLLESILLIDADMLVAIQVKAIGNEP